jgi:hypothetical protein
MRKFLLSLAAFGALVFAAGCNHCDSCHSDNYRQTQTTTSVADAK